MIGWLIILGVLVVVFVASWILLVFDYNYSHQYEWELIRLLSGSLGLLLVMGIVAGYVRANQSTNAFVQQSAYLESHIPEDPIENAALTNKKIELNEWLYNAQWAKEKFGLFSFYSMDIVEFEPID